MNDNFQDETTALLNAALGLVAKEKQPVKMSCALTEGGCCPLLNGTMRALKNSFLPLQMEGHV